MSLVIKLTFEILIIVAIGVIAAKTKIIDNNGKEKLSSLLVDLLLPVSMLASSQQPFTVNNLKGTVYIAIIAFVYYLIAFATGKLIGKIRGMDSAKVAMFTLLIAFANTGFIGMPILKQIIDDQGTLYGAIYNSVFDILYFSYGMYMLTSDRCIQNSDSLADYSSSKTEKISKFKELFKNPMIWIAFLTVILYIMPYRFPEVVTASFDLIGNCMMPVSMLVIGAEIAGMNIKTVIGHKSAYSVSMLRMILFPILTYVVMKIINVDFEVRATAVILAAMPSGSLNVIMAQKYKNNIEFATSAVMQNTILMVLTLPLFVYLIVK